VGPAVDPVGQLPETLEVLVEAAARTVPMFGLGCVAAVELGSQVPKGDPRAIRSAARGRFTAEGYQRTTLRAIAADVGVDAALVTRYFGSKQDLFATATEFRIDLPDLDGAAADDIASMLLPRYFVATGSTRGPHRCFGSC
jgi:hypothetical protein